MTPKQRYYFNSLTLVGLYIGVAITLIGLISQCSCSRPPTNPNPPAKLKTRSIKEQHEAAVVIEVLCKTPTGLKFGYIGSGVITGPTQVLTAGHVIDDPDCIYSAQDANKKHHPLTLEIWKKDLDVARLGSSVPFEPYSPIEISDPPEVGARLCVVTWYPQPSRFCGDYYALSTNGGVANLMWDGRVFGGNSGSAIYDDWGHLVGITTHTRQCPDGSQCIGFGTSLNQVPGIIQ